MWVCMQVCVCVCEREREREHAHTCMGGCAHYFVSGVCVCVSPCASTDGNFARVRVFSLCFPLIFKPRKLCTCACASCLSL